MKKGKEIMIIDIKDWKAQQVKNPTLALAEEHGEHQYFKDKDFSEFLDWRFSAGIYEQYGMLSTTSGLKVVKMFHGTDSNIPTWEITIGDYSDCRTQTFLTEEAAYEEWVRLEELAELVWDTLTPDYADTSNFSQGYKWDRPLVFNVQAITYNEYKKEYGVTYNHPTDTQYMMCRTEECWSPAYSGGYVKASFHKYNKNIPMWRIHLGGADDCSYSQDFICEESAFRKWEEILQAKVVNRDILEDNYFSN